LTYSFTPAINCTCKLLCQPKTGAKDLSIFDAAISLLDKFLKHFFSRLSNKQMDMFVLDLCALFKDYKRSLLDAYESPKKK